MFLPILHLRAKYGRTKMMKRINEAKKELRDSEKLALRDKLDKIQIEKRAIANRKKAEEEIAAQNAANGKASATPLSSTIADKALGNKNNEVINAEDITEEEFDQAVDELYYQVKKFKRRFTIGVIAELLVSIAAVLTFIFTEDMRLPMVLIDRWTPLMILIMAVCIIIDLILARYRKKLLAEEDEELKEETKRLKEMRKQKEQQEKKALKELKKKNST